ncbi:alkaline phosphatase family protein [Halalkalicoccus subterraneus]|uniref:hypothetical protein n=1 Tax=Halalkalicoccus subterraneus TaxID=2675002 RepID=UPI000EFADCE1|nr:hypothetical protein [Halalkalicoccus subterraneus]
METRSRLRRALHNPVLFLRGINRLFYRRLGTREYNPDGIDVFAADWDTLILLDACRYDMFERCADLPGRLERRRSRGSTTVEFLQANVAGRDLSDTVYVTANPQLYQHRASIRPAFHEVVDVWREDGWDEDHGTVLPGTLTAYARQAVERHPNKRLVVHYMQPHYPFLGSDAGFDKGHLDGTGVEAENVWNRLLQGTLDLDRSEIWRLYDENLERVLPSVEELLTELDGKTVVTADHGNMIGERAFPVPFREWGHPRGIYTDELVDVPWLVSESGPRRRITRGTVEERAGTVEENVVTDRLRNLGYAE